MNSIGQAYCKSCHITGFVKDKDGNFWCVSCEKFGVIGLVVRPSKGYTSTYFLDFFDSYKHLEHYLLEK